MLTEVEKNFTIPATTCINKYTYDFQKLPEVSCKIPRLDTVRSPENSDNSESGSSQFSINRSDDIAFHVLKEFKVKNN